MNKNNEADKEKDLEMLCRRYSFLDAERIKIANSFDKYLLTFSTGSLYLSIMFTSKLVGGLNNKYLLGTGWGVLIISIISILLSINFSERAFDKQLSLTNKKIKSIIDDKDPCDDFNYWNTVVHIMKWVGTITFILGIVILSLFYFINL